jgi:hypothetical protein
MPDTKEIIVEMLRRGLPAVFSAGGPSMNPTIRDGETVRLRPLQAGDVRPGAIVLYPKSDRWVLHRLIRRNARTRSVQIVADAAVDGGEWVAETDLLGVAEWVRRAGRVRPLDSPTSRLAGLLRFALRPLRRAIFQLRHPDHAHTPARRP